MAISGLGPHGERATPPNGITITTDDLEEARARKFRAAVIIHTTTSDWSRQQIAGIDKALSECGGVIEEIVDCGFQPEIQVEALARLGATDIDAIISLPIGNAVVAQAHREVAQSGKTLILLDNVPTGLLPGSDYTALVSTDNFGLGLMAADLLSPHVPQGGCVGVLGYDVDFHATNQREIAFARWIKANRPDVSLEIRRFPTLKEVQQTTEEILAAHADLAGLFVVWDTPAMEAVQALGARAIPITTVDLGRDAAISLAQHGPIRGIAAQQPYRQGMAVGRVTVLSLLRRGVPRWVAFPGIQIRADNVAEQYREIWNLAPPAAVLGS